MKASERARRFENDDRQRRGMPESLHTRLNTWSAWSGLIAVLCCAIAWAWEDTTAWVLGAAYALGALVCRMLARWA